MAELFQEVNDPFYFERKMWKEGYSLVCGIDEAGRGPLAGPVIAAAVSAEEECLIEGINDSKKLSSKKRQALLEEILAHSKLQVGIGEASPNEIDDINILQASLLAFQRAAEQLDKKPDYFLLDGNQKCQTFGMYQLPLVKGDSRSFLIACASIVAKETRDKIMVDLEKKYPGYGFEKHKGYPTQFHMKALQKLGPSPVHRKSFKPVRDALGEVPSNEETLV